MYFIGVLVDSVIFYRLTAERSQRLRECLALFLRGRLLSFGLSLRLLGLMALSLVVIQLGSVEGDAAVGGFPQVGPALSGSSQGKSLSGLLSAVPVMEEHGFPVSEYASGGCYEHEVGHKSGRRAV